MKPGYQSVPETGSPFSEESLNSSFFYDEYARSLMRQVGKFGGFNNAHAHLDRANTLDSKYLEHVGISPTE
jgi:hypothetical protein